MSLDGAFIYCLKNELAASELIGSRVDKIHQPTKDDIVITFRAGGKSVKLLISAVSTSARLHTTTQSYENPATPPMFCMLLRKHLGGGKLVSISQDGFERILYFDFECTSEIGDPVSIRLAVELMGKYSNIVLLIRCDEGYRVIDSIKRIGPDMSSVRRILPNIIYQPPEKPADKLNLMTAPVEDIIEAVKGGNLKRMFKQLISCVEGIAPIFARECAYYACRDTEALLAEMTEDNYDRLKFYLTKAKQHIEQRDGFTIVKDLQGNYKDFSFVPIHQYSAEMVTVSCNSANELLESFFAGKAEAERAKQRSSTIMRTIINSYQRIQKRVELQKQELNECKGRDTYRVWGDIINANIYRIKPGATSITAENFYTGEMTYVPLDPSLSAAKNAQKLYAEYKRRETREQKLKELIEAGEVELIYIDSVFDAASRCKNNAELTEIKLELIAGGYIRSTAGFKKHMRNNAPKPQPPLHFVTDDGFEVYIGRNNVQNDKLTMKTARPEDMWLHTKDIAGSHVIIKAKNGEISDTAILQAAKLAAYCSKAQKSTKVPVDYTLVRYVKKPNGAKPGMVIFTNNKTLLVDPDAELFERVE